MQLASTIVLCRTSWLVLWDGPIYLLTYSPTDLLLIQSLRSFKLAVSLGGVVSLVEHPASMSHGAFCMSDEDRKDANIDPGLIRLRLLKRVFFLLYQML